MFKSSGAWRAQIQYRESEARHSQDGQPHRRRRRCWHSLGRCAPKFQQGSPGIQIRRAFTDGTEFMSSAGLFFPGTSSSFPCVVVSPVLKPFAFNRLILRACGQVTCHLRCAEFKREEQVVKNSQFGRLDQDLKTNYTILNRRSSRSSGSRGARAIHHAWPSWNALVCGLLWVRNPHCGSLGFCRRRRFLVASWGQRNGID